MGYQVAALVYSDGYVERLPDSATPQLVLGKEGLLSSTCLGVCTLHWTMTTSYLLGQVNGYCSKLSGQLVRGDAMLTATLTSPAAAQGWLRHIAESSRATTHTPGSMGELQRQTPRQNLPAQTVATPAAPSTAAQKLLPRFTVERDQGVAEGSPEENLEMSGGPHEVEGSAAVSEVAGKEVGCSRSSMPARDGQDSGPPAALGSPLLAAASRIAGDAAAEDCEPRTRLLWSIVGQASSLDWKQKAPPSTACLPDTTPVNQAPEPSGSSNQLGSEVLPMEPSPASHEPVQDFGQAGWSFGEALEESGCPCRADRGFWSDLQPELLFLVAAKLGSVGAVQAMVSACTQWRSALLSDDMLLRQLPFKEPAMSSPFIRKLDCGADFPKSTGLPITTLIHKAAKLGNLRACVAIANHLDTLGMRDEGMGYRKSAAKLGDAKSQVILGTASYLGSAGVLKDSDEAHRWLSRAATQLMNLPLTVMTGALLSKAALHLGYLALDGEATKKDLESAVSWFRLAAKRGSKDAELALGTLLRTGQYGPS